MKITVTQENYASLPEGKYSIPPSLRLVVTKSSCRYWYFRYQLNGKRHEIFLGTVDQLSLDSVKQIVNSIKIAMSEGVDPKTMIADLSKTCFDNSHFEEEPKVITFGNFWEGAVDHIEWLKQWKNKKHKDQWRTTIQTYVLPYLRDKQLDEITRFDIADLLKPIWLEKTETASRVRGRIESIFNIAMTKDLINDNPARWRSGLDGLLPSSQKVAKKTHFKAMPINLVPKFIYDIHDYKGDVNEILLIGILTATRPSEYTGMMWKELDLDKALWVIPKERAKMNKPQRVPLSWQAVQLLRDLKKLSVSEYVFPALGSPYKARHSGVCSTVLRCRPEYSEYTCHGFRSTFKDWCTERMVFPELSEKALGHSKKSKVEEAYQRSDMLEQRRPLMQDWADFVFSKCNWFNKD